MLKSDHREDATHFITWKHDVQIDVSNFYIEADCYLEMDNCKCTFVCFFTFNQTDDFEISLLENIGAICVPSSTGLKEILSRFHKLVHDYYYGPQVVLWIKARVMDKKLLM